MHFVQIILPARRNHARNLEILRIPAPPQASSPQAMMTMTMADRITPEQRSAVMSSIRSKGNKSTELVFRDLMRKNKITGWRRHHRIEGTPDFAFPDKRLAVFIDGCFWHGCPKCYTRPKSNQKYWDTKIENNKKRDVRQRAKLRRDGWRVVRIWEHELKGDTSIVLHRIRKHL